MKIQLTNNKFHFLIINNNLVIKKKTWFSVKEIKIIDIESIQKIGYKYPYEDIIFFLWVLKYLFVFVLAVFIGETTYGKNPYKKYLYITYSVNNEEAIFDIGVKLNNKDLELLHKALLFHKVF